MIWWVPKFKSLVEPHFLDTETQALGGTTQNCHMAFLIGLTNIQTTSETFHHISNVFHSISRHQNTRGSRVSYNISSIVLFFFFSLTNDFIGSTSNSWTTKKPLETPWAPYFFIYNHLFVRHINIHITASSQCTLQQSLLAKIIISSSRQH